MAKKEEKTRSAAAVEKPAPGLPFDAFRRAVEIVVQLRDRGEYLIFLSRANGVRLIGADETFATEFARTANDEPDTPVSDPAAAMREIRLYLSLFAQSRDISRVIEILPFSIPEFRQLHGETSEAVQKALRDKASLCVNSLFTPFLESRANRIGTSVGLSLEEVDVDIVQRRIDELTNRNVSEPFLRVRVRFSEPQPVSDEFSPWMFLRLPVNSARTPAFELDCDEADIDLMIRRLVSAKRAIEDARKELGSKKGENPDE